MPGRAFWTVILVAASHLVWLPAAHGQPVPVGSEFQVNTYTSYFQSSPSVAVDASGNFVVVWASGGGFGSDTSGFSIEAQRYDSAGVPLGGQFQVNTYTTNYQTHPRVAADAAGNFVVVWR